MPWRFPVRLKLRSYLYHHLLPSTTNLTQTKDAEGASVSALAAVLDMHACHTQGSMC